MHGWAPEVIGAVGAPAPNPERYRGVFFASAEASRQLGMEALGRMNTRSEDRDQQTTWQTRQAQYDAVCAWGIADHGLPRGSVRSTCPCWWQTATAAR